MSPRNIKIITCGALVWLSCLIVAGGALVHYSAVPGRGQDPGQSAGRILASLRQPGRALAVVAVHPQCPCTKATLAELGDLLARSHGNCDAVILEYLPGQPAPDWPAPSDLKTLGGVPVRLIVDPAGQIAESLGAKTSGHVVFVDARGEIRFHGGLTLARGHRGRSPAQDAILATLGGHSSSLRSAPVYGCALFPECNSQPTQ